MIILKKSVVALTITLAAGWLFAQTSVQKKDSTKKTSKEEETSVESEYLNDVNTEIILSLANSDSYDNKLVALEYLKEAIDSGNTSEGVVQALNQLAGEGVTSVSRTNGRLTNNYTMIRREACLLLGNIKTERSSNTLVDIIRSENEPMVIAAAVRSLGDIGINEGDKVVEAIAFVNHKNEVLNPTSSLALEVLYTYEMLYDSTEHKRTIIDSVMSIASNPRYNTTIRNEALSILKRMSNDSDSSKKEDKNNNKSNNNDVEEVE